ncbi:hypothetical protein I5M27_03915 [Adhaeribacter sp. BT258]|uniref:DUF4136 domain-containing protein n=1 Tax=Adhaeribacter terrigena TaxID=2793070 RepID=A0ABS1BY93_9BACT|nr:hypothetical protein [Adhaeribacter terrigena]MBK0402116.1 hypothetical protein [Adhaeribacter terrigena]
MKSIKNFLLLFILAGTLFACQNAEKNQKPARSNPKYFAVNIFVGGGLEHPSFNASLFTPDMVSPSFSPGFKHLKMGPEASTLYILKSKNIRATPDTFKLKFENWEIDSLYTLTYNYLSSHYNNNSYVGEGEDWQFPSDQRPIIVSLVYGGYKSKELQCTEWTTESIYSLSKEASQLFSFINKKIAKGFELY